MLIWLTSGRWVPAGDSKKLTRGIEAIRRLEPVQVAAYVVLITGAKSNEENASYSIFSISLAMFLMISISSSDIRASHALLFWGGSWGRCLFGAVMVGCTGLLVAASLRVLFMDAENNAELVIGAASVLFIEDVDNKLATVFTGVPKKWRLFWMLEILSASFCIAVAGAIEFGDSTAVLDEDLQGGGFNLKDILGYDWLYAIGWVLTMWALMLSHLVNNKSRAFRALRRSREPSVLPVTRESVPSDSAQQNERENRHQVLVKICYFISIVFVYAQYFSYGGFWWLVLVYSASVFLCFLAGVLRATLDLCGACPRRGTPGPPQFMGYRVFIGWGLGTLFYLVYYWPVVSYTMFPVVVEFLLMSVELLLIVDHTFFGKWGGQWIRRLQEFLMAKNGCIYWTVYFHVVYSVAWWTIDVVVVMILVLD